MKFCALEKMRDCEVEKWLIDNIPELTEYQKQCIRDDEIVRFSSIEFMKRPKKQVSNIFLRFSIIFMLPVIILIFASLPFKFFLTGKWGYTHEQVAWFGKWCNVCGF